MKWLTPIRLFAVFILLIVAACQPQADVLPTVMDINATATISAEAVQASTNQPPTLPPTPRVWNGPYLKKRMPLDPWGRVYLYKSPGEGDPATYDLQSLGADGRPGGYGRDADIRSWE